MKKFLILGIIGAIALFVVVKKTNVCSYATTFVSNVSTAAKEQVPNKFELERIRNEIAALDGDISAMIRPIAEYKVAINKLRTDITKQTETIAKQKSDLLNVVKDLEQNSKEYRYGDQTYTAAQVRKQLDRSTHDLKKLENQLKSKQQILEAKETSLRATQDQLAKLISMKRDFEVELTRLEAEEETLTVAKIGSTVKVDNSRATMIKDALAAIEHRQNVERDIVNQANNGEIYVPLSDRRPAFDLNAVRSYLEGNEQPADKTVSNK
jgi:chromosome segregation ATPase